MFHTRSRAGAAVEAVLGVVIVARDGLAQDGEIVEPAVAAGAMEDRPRPVDGRVPHARALNRYIRDHDPQVALELGGALEGALRNPYAFALRFGLVDTILDRLAVVAA